MNLQSSLRELSQAYIEVKDYNKPLEVRKKEKFSIHNNLFITLIEKLPVDFYLEETTYDSHVTEISDLTVIINNKIESLNKSKK